MIKIAANLERLYGERTRTKQALKAKELLDMDSGGGLFSDYWGPAGWNTAFESRPGRATAMAEAIGEDPGFFVKNPLTSGALMTLPGIALGAGAGYGIGNLASGDPDVQGLGAIGGGVAGAFLGHLIASAIRRNKMHDIAAKFDKARSKKPQAFEPSSSLFFLGGSHDLGRAKAIEAMKGRIDPEEASEYGFKPFAAFGGDIAGGVIAAGLPLGYYGTRAYDKVQAAELVRAQSKGKKKKNKKG